MTNRPFVGGASPEPGVASGVEQRIVFRVERHRTLTSAKALVRGRTWMAEGSEKRETSVYVDSTARPAARGRRGMIPVSDFPTRSAACRRNEPLLARSSPHSA